MALSRARAPRTRSLGHGRTLRRTLGRGGTGLAGRLNAAVGGWPGVRVTALFGRWGYLAAGTLFACFPLREKDRDLWVRLGPDDQRRALGDARVRPHRRFARRGWIELDVAAPRDLDLALRWLRRAYAAALAVSSATSQAAADFPIPEEDA